MDKLFENFRPRLMAIGYRMLGSAVEAEDMVQETFIRWHRTNQTTLENPQGWLTTVMTRLCIDRLRLLQKERELYPGPWLPTPLVSEPVEKSVLQIESLSYAMLVVLEKLAPVERAVFLLREVFDLSYEEIGEIVERSAVNCRQIFSRAKGRLDDRQLRFPISPELHEQLFYKFIASCQSGQLDELIGHLTEDIVVWSDGGGKAAAARHPIHGAQKAAQFLLGLLRLAPEGAQLEIKPLNGQMSLIVNQNGTPIMAMLLDFAGEKIAQIFFVRNPEKLGHL